jgi:hypothetical protein
MANRLSAILGANGQPMPNGHTNGHARRELYQLVGLTRRAGGGRERAAHPDVRASYDAARTSDDMKNYWANADAHDADSANSKTVRARLVQRSRYEVANNGYADGMVQTSAVFFHV